MTEHHIGSLDDFPAGRGHRVEIDGIRIAVFNIDGELYGIQDRCPHKNLPLSAIGEEIFVTDEVESEETPRTGRINDDKKTIHCPWHFLEWDLETGHCPATDTRVGSYDVNVDDRNDVYVTI